MNTIQTRRWISGQLLLAALVAMPFGGYCAAGGGAAKSLAAAVRPFVESNTLAGGVMLVASKEKVLDVEAAGWADIAKQQAMKTDALFWIASQSKPMTAAAFMLLVEEGKVNLDDAVEKYLPEFKGQMLAVERDGEHVLLRKPAHPITVREILSHTSGLPFASRMEQPTLDGLPLRDAVRSYAMGALEFAPGTKYQYSISGSRWARTHAGTAGLMPRT